MDKIPEALEEQSKMPQSLPTGENVIKIHQDDNSNNGDSTYGSIDSSSSIVRALFVRNINK